MIWFSLVAKYFITSNGRSLFYCLSYPILQKLYAGYHLNSYWLVKKHYFETILVAGKMRVLVGSFEDWYQGQTHYKKVAVPGNGGEEAR